MNAKSPTVVAGIFFKFLLFLGIFLAAYFFFVIMGNALGVFSLLPYESPFANAVTDGMNRPVFVIDPGHGGIDGGALAPDGTPEKEINLSLSLMLGEFLEAAGAEVVYTRTDDVMLETPGAPTKKSGDVMARVAVAKNNPDADFVSIHMNKFPQKQYKGLQVFFSDNHAESELLAHSVQENVARYLQPDNNRSAKKAGSEIYVLDRIQTPAILIECGFLSNDEEYRLLKSEDYLRRLAFIIAHSLLEKGEQTITTGE